MSERITNKEIEIFLRDFALYSETEILEEGKEKNEVIAIARAKDIDLKDNRDLAGFKTIYTFADIANKNRARLPQKALLKALPSMIGKPVDLDHNRRYVVGHYIDYRYKQKENMVIAYGVFYKSNFGEEWEKVKALFKANKLATSYEIWCPKDKRRILADGTYELLQQEIAGGALLLKEDPAFEDAKVLELAKKNSEAMEADLVFAQYKEDEIIIGEEQEHPTLETTSISNTEVIVPITSSDNVVTEPVVTTPICSNCGQEFNPNTPLNEIKCKKCFAILDKSGNMIYPPQIMDFKVLCPHCRVNSWLMLSKQEDITNIKCLACVKEYKITFDKKQNINPIIEKLEFIYEGSVPCYQCNNNIYFSGISSIQNKTLKCNKCGLEFSHDIHKELHKRISKIEEIKIDKNQETSEKGGTEMNVEPIKASEVKIEVPTPETPQVVEVKVEEQVVEAPVEAKIITQPEAKQETKVEEVKATEQPEVEVKAEKAPKAEEKPVEARFEYQIVDETLETVEPAELVEAEKITYQQRKGLDDKSFAVVVTVKNKKTGGTRKVRMFPIHDEAHVRNALARLGQDAPKATLTKLGVSVESVRAKILRRARELKMTDLVNRYKAGIKKVATNYKKMKKVMMDECAFYKQNAEEIGKRRKEVGEFGTKLSDKEIMIDEKFVQAKVNKENSGIVKASVVGQKIKSDIYYSQIKKQIDKEAFGNN
jgi:predicted Zn-ribbon and HTH transcriptional regulator